MQLQRIGKMKSFIVLVAFVGVSLALSGCGTCTTCGSASSASTSNVGMLRGTIGYPTCDNSSSPICVEKTSPSEVVVGKSFAYQIKVKNCHHCLVDDVVIIEKMNSDFKFEKADPEPASNSGNVATWNLGLMKPGEVKIITLTGSVPSAGEFPSCTKVTFNPLLCLGPKAYSPALNVKLQAPAESLLCDKFPISVTVSNSGTGVASNIVTSQALPEGLMTTDGKSSIAMNVGTLAGGQSKSYTVQVKAQKAGSFENVATANADRDLSAKSELATTVVKQPVLKISQTGPESVFIGRTGTFEITVQNVGDASSKDTVVKTKVPSNMKVLNATEGAKASGKEVVWNLGTLDAGQSKTMSVTVQSKSGGAGEATSTVSGVCAQPASSKSQTSVQGIAAILLEMVDDPDPVAIGNETTYTIAVTNQGSAPDTNIKVKLSLEKEFEYVSASGETQLASSTASGAEFAPLPSLAPGDRVVWKVVAKAKEAGDSRTTVEVTSDQAQRPLIKTESTHAY